MKILLLGSHYKELGEFLESFGDEVIGCESPISKDSDIIRNVEFVISYGYRHIIRKDVIDIFQEKIINLHISFLPYNRGADPNLWSFLEDSPKGVTIHLINEGIDTGDILLQKEACLPQNATLKTSYELLSECIEQLFEDNWKNIKDGKIKSIPQKGTGSVHRLKDRKQYEHLLRLGWDTPVKNIIGKALKAV